MHGQRVTSRFHNGNYVPIIDNINYQIRGIALVHTVSLVLSAHSSNANSKPLDPAALSGTGFVCHLFRFPFLDVTQLGKREDTVTGGSIYSITLFI